ncbi:MAG TPA: gliding motility-associated C-terminal domain-containing protein, partial [Bacteroidia bacterium]|nr:gliding motility-associated C-terminal domain-containing protein [Bacteroidia bacterium]
TISVNVSSVNASCLSNTEGSAGVTVTGCTGGLTYNWSNGQTTQTDTGLSAGIYTMTVQCSSSMCKATTTAIINKGPAIAIKGQANIACYGGHTGSAIVAVSNDNGSPFKYLWSSGQTTSVATNLMVGTYTVTVTDSAGCKKTDSITIVQPSKLVMSLDSITNVLCFGDNTGFMSVSANGGSPGYQYSWSPAEGVYSWAKKLVAGPYMVFVTDVNGCKDSLTETISQPTPLSVSTIPSIKMYSWQDTVLSASASGGTTPYSYLWSNAMNGSSIKVSPETTTTYTVVVTDSNGCTATSIVTVFIESCGEPFVPDAFSPNGDGQNDYLFVRSQCLKTLDFIVFDRWGNKIFETNNQSVPWDGRYRGEPMNTGTYVYYLNATLYDGTTVTKKGNVTLVR